MIPAETITAVCGECKERFEIPTPDRLGDRVYSTCPRCQIPLTGRWYGKVIEVPPRPVTDDDFEQLPIFEIPAHIDGPEIEYPVVLPAQVPKNVRRYRAARNDGEVER